MDSKKIFRYALILSLLAFASAATGLIFKAGKPTWLLFLAGFVILSVAVRGYPVFKGFSYTLLIFAAVILSMIYPGPFVKVGTFEMKKLIVPLLQIIMFGMGSQMSLQDFTGVIKMPKGVIIGVVSHYLVMPLVGFAIASLFSFPPEIAAGIILIGCVPSGLASNVMSFLAKANLALAITVGAISTLLSPFITPILMKWLGGQFIEVNFWNMMFDILNMIILPVVAGFIFNLFAKKVVAVRSKVIQLSAYLIIIVLTNLVFLKSKDAGMADFFINLAKNMIWFYFLPITGAVIFSKLLRGEDSILSRVLSFFSMAGIAVIITIITASGRDSLLQVGGLLMITSLLHNLSGYTLGYSLSWLVGLPERDRRTIAFEVGMQNGGLASGLALQMGKVATVGLAPAIFGPLMNITGSTLATWWRNRPVEQITAPGECIPIQTGERGGKAI
ncbi:MAG: bile acid:sodium symporter family protein [Bacteroidales bacterium]|jgi:BASS family bile acid:Na+ symporter|nr:bile acid:sodium symporter family protein [Bacteroidales bacterium]